MDGESFSENFGQVVSVEDGDISAVGEANLFGLMTSELAWLDEKSEEVKGLLENETRDQENSIAIVSQCSCSNFAGEGELVEMVAGEILAEQSHLCSICGKEFRREGNVRMHMRSHGEHYKSKETLMSSRPKYRRRSYYSCPFQGCRHNKRHPYFKCLKSIVSLRNHYKRSHCVKMYSCTSCGKGFSLVGDLKTHGNKCGRSENPVAVSTAENSMADDQTPKDGAQGLNTFALQDSSTLAEC